MLRRNFLSLFGLTAIPTISFGFTKEKSNFIEAEKDVIYRFVTDSLSGMIEIQADYSIHFYQSPDDFPYYSRPYVKTDCEFVEIQYRKNGKLHNSYGPAVIKSGIMNGNVVKELGWYNDGKFQCAIDKPHHVLIDGNSYSASLLKGSIFRKSECWNICCCFTDDGSKSKRERFEKQIGMTLEQLHSFN